MPATATGAPKAQRDCADETRLGCRTLKLAVYRRRRSERTLLYCTVQNHLATWLALHDDGTGCCVPGVTEREFRRHLECGILDRGFARARCADCGHDFLVAYSSKGRGVCPSCTTRRMVEAATHFDLHVIPRLPVGQRVLSVPKRLRYHGSEGGGGYLPPPLSMRFNMIMITRLVVTKTLHWRASMSLTNNHPT